MEFDKIKLIIFDLDGTLYNGNTVIENAVEAVTYCQDKYHVEFLTNNSSKMPKDICLKLNRMGFECEESNVYTSSKAMIDFLKENNIDIVYAIGSYDFMNGLCDAGITIKNNDSAFYVVVGFDKNFNYDMIRNAVKILKNGGKLLVCNEDKHFPSETFRYNPGCGIITSALQYVSDHDIDYIVGKPNDYMFTKLAVKYNILPDEIVAIGDLWESDVEASIKFGCNVIFYNKVVNFTGKNLYTIDNLIKVKEVL